MIHILPAHNRLYDEFYLNSSDRKASACNVGDLGWIPVLGRSPGEGNGNPLQHSCTSLVALLVKNLPSMWETWVQSLGWEDSLEKEKATHSSILAGEFNGLYSPWVHQESDTTERLSLSRNVIWDIYVI